MNADVGLLFDSLSKYIQHLESALISYEENNSQLVPARDSFLPLRHKLKAVPTQLLVSTFFVPAD